MLLGLTPEQITTFDRDGYLLLRQSIPPDLVSYLSHATDKAMSNGVKNFKAGQPSVRVSTLERNGKPYLLRINDLFQEPNPVFLELLGCPQIMTAATALAGERCISAYESIVIKNEGDDEPIKWHRDMVHGRQGRIFTMGIYLDASRKGKGALRIVPGSQSSAMRVCEFEDAMQRGECEVVDVEMEPGDVLLHDVMAVHASDPLQGQACRRTVYFEFRSHELAVANPGYSAEWIELRHELMRLARQRWQRSQAGAEDREAWTAEERALIAQMYAIPARNEPGEYCFRPHAAAV